MQVHGLSEWRGLEYQKRGGGGRRGRGVGVLDEDCKSRGDRPRHNEG